MSSFFVCFVLFWPVGGGVGISAAEHSRQNQRSLDSEVRTQLCGPSLDGESLSSLLKSRINNIHLNNLNGYGAFQSLKSSDQDLFLNF